MQCIFIGLLWGILGSSQATKNNVGLETKKIPYNVSFNAFLNCFFQKCRCRRPGITVIFAIAALGKNWGLDGAA